MKTLYKSLILLAASVFVSCADNTLDVEPMDDNFPLQLVFDAEEGGDLADAEDYDVEVKFSDLLPDQELPTTAVDIEFEITDVEGSFTGVVTIDKIVYEVEIDDCVYERELEFTTTDGLTGTIHLVVDEDLETVPEAFEVVFVLPGVDDTEGGFAFELTDISTSENLILGTPAVFEYEVLDNDVAGEWELELTEEEFNQFKEVFGSLNNDLNELEYSDITGSIKVEFEYEEVKFEIELTETEMVTTCEDGEEETEEVNKIIEIEAEYGAEDGELELEGSHEIVNNEGVVEEELDFIIEAAYELDEVNEQIIFTFFKVLDEDNYDEGEELFATENGYSFVFNKD